ncbi:MAG: hypothetical protein CVV00_11835 [Firmicutes bacterium HGW-Firmicutes-5]|nr:MAG: hypothetical protein CVV00_11835 [Firmicutes bacterium HGW-Firmicutes-5]
MMISPESYYVEYLKGKTKEQIMGAIRGLKQEIGRLKNALENPLNSQELFMYPSEETRLLWNREYLKRARQAYAEAGGTYVLSKAEEKAADFDLNINFICKITFNIGSFFGGFRSYVVVRFVEVRAYTKFREEEEPLVLLDEGGQPFTKETYIAALADLHIGEWRRRYTTKRFGYTVCDGTQWELIFEYNNGHKPVRFDGDNAYPYNFERLKMLFGIVDTEEEEDY